MVAVAAARDSEPAEGEEEAEEAEVQGGEAGAAGGSSSSLIPEDNQPPSQAVWVPQGSPPGEDLLPRQRADPGIVRAPR